MNPEYQEGSSTYPIVNLWLPPSGQLYKCHAGNLIEGDVQLHKGFVWDAEFSTDRL